MSRILIVEDERHLAEALGQIMAEQKYQVDVVYDGADGLDGCHAALGVGHCRAQCI